MNWKPLALAALALAPLQADFSYRETTKITGGSLTKMMRFVPGGGKMMEPKTSYVYLKGDRLAHVFPESMSVIDLASETMTEVNFEKKTYATITFAEMREAMEKMAARMQDAMSKRKGEPMPQIEMKVSVKNTGQTRAISGLDTREYLMNLKMTAQEQQGAAPVGLSEIESDMWLTAKILGYEEVKAFYLRMGKKMAYSLNMNPLLMQQQGSAEGMKKMAEEMAKLEGTPVLTITRVKGISPMAGMMGGGASNSASNSASSADNADNKPRLGGLAGMAAGGIMGGLRRKSKDAPKAEEAPAAKADDSVLMETQSESANFSSEEVSAAKFNVPAGFQQVEHQMKKALDRK